MTQSHSQYESNQWEVFDDIASFNFKANPPTVVEWKGVCHQLLSQVRTREAFEKTKSSPGSQINAKLDLWIDACSMKPNKQRKKKSPKSASSSSRKKLLASKRSKIRECVSMEALNGQHPEICLNNFARQKRAMSLGENLGLTSFSDEEEAIVTNETDNFKKMMTENHENEKDTRLSSSVSFQAESDSKEFQNTKSKTKFKLIFDMFNNKKNDEPPKEDRPKYEQRKQFWKILRFYSKRKPTNISEKKQGVDKPLNIHTRSRSYSQSSTMVCQPNSQRGWQTESLSRRNTPNVIRNSETVRNSLRKARNTEVFGRKRYDKSKMLFKKPLHPRIPTSSENMINQDTDNDFQNTRSDLERENGSTDEKMFTMHGMKNCIKDINNLSDGTYDLKVNQERKNPWSSSFSEQRIYDCTNGNTYENHTQVYQAFDRRTQGEEGIQCDFMSKPKVVLPHSETNGPSFIEYI